MNATNQHLSKILSKVGGSGEGTLVCVTIRKKGVTRGKGSDKQTYNNDLVKVLLWCGFDYKSLVERSSIQLDRMWNSSNSFIHDLAVEVRGTGYDEVTLQDASEAVVEVSQSLSSSNYDLASNQSDSLWEPLKIDGVKIKGTKIYNGKSRPDDPKAPIPGTLYIDGVKLGEIVLEKAPRWEPKRKPKTVAKDIIRNRLPVGSYVRYCLNSGNYLDLVVGEEASEAAKKAGILIDPELIQSLFKIAP